MMEGLNSDGLGASNEFATYGFLRTVVIVGRVVFARSSGKSVGIGDVSAPV